MKGKIKRYIEHLVKKLIPYIRERYKIKNFDVSIRVSFDHRRTHSWGGVENGRPFVNLAIDYEACRNALLKGTEINLFEYEDYEHHPLIGSNPTGNWKFYIYRLTMHELAHCVELYPMRLEKRLKFHSKLSIADNRESGHGMLFQEIYIDLVKNNWNFESGCL